MTIISIIQSPGKKEIAYRSSGGHKSIYSARVFYLYMSEMKIILKKKGKLVTAKNTFYLKKK
jgi:hypothetical protein